MAKRLAVDERLPTARHNFLTSLLNKHLYDR